MNDFSDLIPSPSQFQYLQREKITLGPEMEPIAILVWWYIMVLPVAGFVLGSVPVILGLMVISGIKLQD